MKKSVRNQHLLHIIIFKVIFRANSHLAFSLICKGTLDSNERRKVKSDTERGGLSTVIFVVHSLPTNGTVESTDRGERPLLASLLYWIWKFR